MRRNCSDYMHGPVRGGHGLSPDAVTGGRTRCWSRLRSFGTTAGSGVDLEVRRRDVRRVCSGCLLEVVFQAQTFGNNLGDHVQSRGRKRNLRFPLLYAHSVSLRIRLSLGNPGAMPPERTAALAPPAALWPFVYPLVVDWPDGPTVLSVPAIHEAFVNHQTAGTRLVTTQPSFLLQTWRALSADRDVLIAATADRASLEQHAPEVLARRGPFADIEIDDSTPGKTGPALGTPHSDSALGTPHSDSHSALRTPHSHSALETQHSALLQAFRVDDPAERLRLCITALDRARTPAALVATASTCMEVNDLDAAARDLDEAIALAPQWAAAHFERGKLWLRTDDMDAASVSFRQAAVLMPSFGPAWANLGATLGELDQPGAALEAFSQALHCDPGSHQTLNNIGVVSRELGKLAESEAAFRQVIQLVPDMAFGYYNLGHTLFLGGRYQAALGAYAEGQKRDPERNQVQATRLAMCRLATGDAPGALRDLQRATDGLPRDYRQQLLADTRTIALALLTHRPDLPGWQHVNDWLAKQLTT